MDVLATFARSARGDVEAHRALAREGYRRAYEEGDTLICLVEALIFARMAAAQGDNSDDALVLVLLGSLRDFYRLAGLPDHADVFEGEAFAVLNKLADQGDDVADGMIMAAAEQLSPSAMAYAWQDNAGRNRAACVRHGHDGGSAYLAPQRAGVQCGGSPGSAPDTRQVRQ